MNAPRPANVAQVDKHMADATAVFDTMVESYRRTRVALNLDAAAQHLIMTRATLELYDHVEAAHLVSAAVARHGSCPAISSDLLRDDVVPAGPHSVALVTASRDGMFVAICVCAAVFTDEAEDDAVAALDAHLVQMAGA